VSFIFCCALIFVDTCAHTLLVEVNSIFHYQSAQEEWPILETTYEGTKIVKSAKRQMLISKFEEIKMLDDETFGEFYTKISNLKNLMVSLGKRVSDVKLIKKILRSLPERFRIKVTTFKESKDLDSMKIEELVGSLQTYEYSLSQSKRHRRLPLRRVRIKVESPLMKTQTMKKMM
jgi:hypothetical protein